MDSGMLSLEDGFVDQEVSEMNRSKGHFGSLQLKQPRSGSSADDDENWRASKFFKGTSLNEESTGSLFQRSGSMVAGDDGQQMLCFSSSSSNSKPQEGFYLSRVAAEDGSSRYQEFPFFQANERAQGGLARSHEGVYGLHRMHGPFSSSQFTELKHQALIYNHLAANVPVPSGLLNPLRKSLNPYAFSGLSSGSYVSNSLGWGPFHLGFSSNTDPEPGRCRRTDGKKWRCSRDAVPDQKYCERHINRGRHRSRKPVEGQTGHAISGSTKVASFSPSSATLKSSGVACNNLGGMKNPCKSSLNIGVNPPTDHLVDRTQEPHCPSIIHPGINLEQKDSMSTFQKQHNEPNQPVFGLVPSDSLLNPSQNCTLMSSQNCNPIMSLGGQDNDDQHAFRHFIHQSPKDQTDQVSIAWPGEIKSDWTQLSMSIPVTSSNFSSSPNSPQQKKLTLSPLRLAGEVDPIQMGLSITNASTTEPIPKQAHWLPVSWGSSIGGPLGEVLKNTSNTAGGNGSSSPLNLIPDQWDSSPQLGSSPTGVLQKSAFVSLSNSSAGSSQRAGGTTQALEMGSFRDDMLGSTLGSSPCNTSI